MINIFRRYKVKKCYVIIVLDQETGAWRTDHVCMFKCDAQQRVKFIQMQGENASIEEALIEVE